MKPDAIKALIKAQSEMGAALKKATNPHFRSKYADLGAVQDACLEPLHNNGFAVIQPSGNDEGGAFVDTIFMHESGESITSRIYLMVDKNNMQGIGSAIPYARRYGLLGLSGVAPEDDDGHEAAKAPPKKQDAPTVSLVEISTAVDSINSLNNMDDLKMYWSALAKNQPALSANVDVLTAKNARKIALDVMKSDDIPY